MLFLFKNNNFIFFLIFISIFFRSFGNDKMLLEMLDLRLNRPRKIITRKSIESGLILGAGYFTIAAVTALLNYIGALLVVD